MWKWVYALLYISTNLLTFTRTGNDFKNVFVILSQPNRFHLNLAQTLKEKLLNDNHLDEGNSPVVHLSHVDFPHVGHWTVLPILPHLLTIHGSNCSWLIFLQDFTDVRMEKLYDTLNRYDSNKEIWLGYAVYDDQPTIIHHYKYSEKEKYKYPISPPGFAISMALVKGLEERLKNLENYEELYSIDYMYELSLFLWDDGKGFNITHEPSFCPSEGDNCSTYPKTLYPCKEQEPKESIFIAVKTHSSFHGNRLPVVKDTWAKHTPHVAYFSDIEDDKYGTISLDIPNVERGHCAKTMAIIKYVAEMMTDSTSYRWLFLVDDDTILSVTRAREILSCYNEDDNIALGERYGYAVITGRGYNYLTGGAGTLISKPLIKKLAEGIKCVCPSLTSPDDMFLGACLKAMNVDVIHSPAFHQARPMDYSPQYLQSQLPVTFHKHWMTDPRQIYEKWFLTADKNIKDEL